METAKLHKSQTVIEELVDMIEAKETPETIERARQGIIPPAVGAAMMVNAVRRFNQAIVNRLGEDWQELMTEFGRDDELARLNESLNKERADFVAATVRALAADIAAELMKRQKGNGDHVDL